MVWSPDGLTFVFPEITFVPEALDADPEAPPQFYSHLRQVAAADGSSVDLSGSEGFLVEDAGPAYSPDGRWIAFSRRGLASETWTPGRQVWRMRSDGAEALPLTDAASLNHAAVSWSPDGTRIAYMLFDQLNPTQPAEMRWQWVDGNEGGLIPVPESDAPAGGYAPAWIP
jgi:dipeptidyl aminopeptidase/acylaminoacyl peptidase